MPPTIFVRTTLEEENTRAWIANTNFLIGEWIKGAFIVSDYVLRDIVNEVPVSELSYPTTDAEHHARRSVFLEDKRNMLPKIILFGLFDEHFIAIHTNSTMGFNVSERAGKGTLQSE